MTSSRQAESRDGEKTRRPPSALRPRPIPRAFRRRLRLIFRLFVVARRRAAPSRVRLLLGSRHSSPHPSPGPPPSPRAPPPSPRPPAPPRGDARSLASRFFAASASRRLLRSSAAPAPWARARKRSRALGVLRLDAHRLRRGGRGRGLVTSSPRFIPIPSPPRRTSPPARASPGGKRGARTGRRLAAAAAALSAAARSAAAARNLAFASVRSGPQGEPAPAVFGGAAGRLASSPRPPRTSARKARRRRGCSSVAGRRSAASRASPPPDAPPPRSRFFA